MSRSLLFVALLCAMPRLGHAHAADDAEVVAPKRTASEWIVYKHTQWPLSVIEFRSEKDGLADGYAYRYSWPQRMNDAYGLYDAEGVELGQAAFTGKHPAAYTSAGAQMAITCPKGMSLGSIAGTWATWHRGKFTMRDALGVAVAVAYVDYFGSAIFIVDAKTERKTLATVAYLDTMPSVEPPFWTVRLYDSEMLPPIMARAFVAYVADYQAWFSGYGMANRVKSYAETFLPGVPKAS